MSCAHDITEREVAVADGYCPLCMAVELGWLRAALEKIAKDEKNCADHCRKQASRALERARRNPT
jgi:hypothetical protein